jgi:hypothetical protein
VAKIEQLIVDLSRSNNNAAAPDVGNRVSPHPTSPGVGALESNSHGSSEGVKTGPIESHSGNAFWADLMQQVRVAGLQSQVHDCISNARGHRRRTCVGLFTAMYHPHLLVPFHGKLLYTPQLAMRMPRALPYLTGGRL